MKTQPVETTLATPELKTAAPDDRERLIESLIQLLSTGRSLSELMEEAKRLAESGLSEATANKGVEPAPAGVRLRREPAADTGDNPSVSGETERPTAAVSARAQQERRTIRLPWLIRRIHVWLVPAIGLPALAGAAGTAVFLNLPIVADATPSEPPSTSKPMVQASNGTPVPPAVKPGSSLSLGPEEVNLLLARGDALMSMADASSGRPFYERAVAAGSAQAALRLGASYDPSFLARAGLRGVRGDPALAAYWYNRARDLGAVEAETLLKSIDN
jgi:hypothetical protein